MIKKVLKALEDEDGMWFWTPFTQKETGLNMRVYAYSCFCEDVAIKAPIMLFQNNSNIRLRSYNELVCISIEEDPPILDNTKIKLSDDDITLLKKWISTNKSALIAHYKGETSSLELFRQLRLIKDV